IRQDRLFRRCGRRLKNRRTCILGFSRRFHRCATRGEAPGSCSWVFGKPLVLHTRQCVSHRASDRGDLCILATSCQWFTDDLVLYGLALDKLAAEKLKCQILNDGRRQCHALVRISVRGCSFGHGSLTPANVSYLGEGSAHPFAGPAPYGGSVI